MVGQENKMDLQCNHKSEIHSVFSVTENDSLAHQSFLPVKCGFGKTDEINIDFLIAEALVHPRQIFNPFCSINGSNGKLMIVPVTAKIIPLLDKILYFIFGSSVL